MPSVLWCLFIAFVAVGDAQLLRGSQNATKHANATLVPGTDATPCWSGLQTVKEYVACLSSVPLDVETRDCTLQILAEQLRELYTYSDLIRNSTNNDAELAPGFDFAVHNVTLGPYIDALWPQLQAETSAGMFAMRLTELFTKMHDAHTSIKFKLLQNTKVFAPVVVATVLDEQGAMQFQVVATRTWAPADILNKTISSVNGLPALDYFLKVASLRAVDKSRGAQLNRFLLYQHLNGVVPPDEGLFNVTFSDGGMEQLRWMVRMDENVCQLGLRQQLCSREDVMSGRCTTSVEVMKQCFAHNPEFDDFADMMSKLGRPLPCTAKGRSDTRGVQAPMQSPPPGLPLLASSRPEEAESAETEVTIELAREPPVGESFLAASLSNFVAEGAVGQSPRTTLTGCACKQVWKAYSWSCNSYCCSPDHDPLGDWCVLEDPSCEGGKQWSYCKSEVDEGPRLSVLHDGHSCTALRAELEDRSVTVLKIKDFSSRSDLKPCVGAAVTSATEASGGDLIVDVISNGGGDVSAGYELNQYLYENMPGSSFRNQWDSCEWYDLPQNPELSWLVGLSQSPLPRLEEVPEPREHILGLARRMRKALESLRESRSLFGQWTKGFKLASAAECLEVLVAKFAATASPVKPQGGHGDRVAWQEFSSLYDQCVRAAKPFGGDGLQIMDYRVSNKHPDPLSAPSWEYYTSTVTKIRGGQARNFSSMTFLSVACKAYRAMYPEVYGSTVLTAGGWPAEPQKTLRHVTYLSDGLCGSTCSVASTAPYLDGLTTFVTYGGVKGEALDITSFNGGNVGAYQKGQHALWKAALSPAVDASIFFPDAKPPTWPFAPVPMNLESLRFAQRAEYPRALGPKALPREWYTIPASHHLDVWTTLPLGDYKHLTSAGKWQLYKLYAATAALPPKPLTRVPSVLSKR